MKITPPIRKHDRHGSGAYNAPRGHRKHRGVDVACYENSLIHAIEGGVVTKIGYPYNPDDPKKGHLRYVQVTDILDRDWRYFYVTPKATLGTTVMQNQIIGEAQGLRDIYEGITDHIHVEIMISGEWIDPTHFVFPEGN